MKILWHSNAPFVPTGYGQQTATFAPLLNASGHDVAVSDVKKEMTVVLRYLEDQSKAAAAMADALDGRVARLVKGESMFGVEFDSLADFLTFGVSPAIVAVRTAVERVALDRDQHGDEVGRANAQRDRPFGHTRRRADCGRARVSWRRCVAYRQVWRWLALAGRGPWRDLESGSDRPRIARRVSPAGL